MQASSSSPDPHGSSIRLTILHLPGVRQAAAAAENPELQKPASCLALLRCPHLGGGPTTGCVLDDGNGNSSGAALQPPTLSIQSTSFPLGLMRWQPCVECMNFLMLGTVGDSPRLAPYYCSSSCSSKPWACVLPPSTLDLPFRQLPCCELNLVLLFTVRLFSLPSPCGQGPAVDISLSSD